MQELQAFLPSEPVIPYQRIIAYQPQDRHVGQTQPTKIYSLNEQGHVRPLIGWSFPWTPPKELLSLAESSKSVFALTANGEVYDLPQDRKLYEGVQGMQTDGYNTMLLHLSDGSYSFKSLHSTLWLNDIPARHPIPRDASSICLCEVDQVAYVLHGVGYLQRFSRPERPTSDHPLPTGADYVRCSSGYEYQTFFFRANGSVTIASINATNDLVTEEFNPPRPVLSMYGFLIDDEEQERAGYLALLDNGTVYSSEKRALLPLEARAVSLFTYTTQMECEPEEFADVQPPPTHSYYSRESVAILFSNGQVQKFHLTD